MGLTAEQIAEAFAQEAHDSANTRCRVGAIIAEHPALEEKIMDLNYSAPAVSRTLKRLGLPQVSDSLIRQHRRDECRCV